MHTQYTVICTRTDEELDVPMLLAKLIDAGMEVGQLAAETGSDGLMSVADAKAALAVCVQSFKPVQLLPVHNWVAFSPTEAGFGEGAGYWSVVDGWVTADLASVLTTAMRQATPLPESVGDDAMWSLVETFACPSTAITNALTEYRLVLEFDEDKDHRAEEVLIASSPDAAEARAMETYRNARVIAMYRRIR